MLTCLACRPPALPTPPKVAAEGCDFTQAARSFDLMGWDASSRAQLNQMRKEGVVAVRYHADGCEVQLELLSNCRGVGEYHYGAYEASDTKLITGEAQLFAELPLGAVGLRSHIKSNRAIRTDSDLVGVDRLPGDISYYKEDLTGVDCDRATHVVSSIYLGGFAIVAGASRELESAASVFKFGTGAGNMQSISQEKIESNPVACEQALSSGTETPRCNTPLRVSLLPIDVAGGRRIDSHTPVVESLSLTESDDLESGRIELIITGQNLQKLAPGTLSKWTTALAGTGIEVTEEFLIGEGNQQASATVRVAPAFSRKSLPVPVAIENRFVQKKVSHHIVMRVAILAANRKNTRGIEQIFRNARDFFNSHQNGNSLTFNDYIHFEHFSLNEVSSLVERIDEFDLLYANPFAYITLTDQIRENHADESPFTLAACNLGKDNATSYRSAIFTRKGSALDELIPLDGELTSELLYTFLLTRSLQVVWGPEGSTAGHVIPCLDWKNTLKGKKIRNVYSTDHAATVTRVLAENGPPRIGVSRLNTLQEKGTDTEGNPLYRVLWESDQIPHGAILLHKGKNPHKANLYRTAFRKFIQMLEGGETSMEWLEFGGVQGLARCNPMNFEQLARKIRQSPNASRCDVEHIKD